jgi:hypothetical protein
MLVEFKWPKAGSCSARFEEGNEILGSSRRGKVTDLLIYHQHFEKVWSIFHRGVRIGGVL